MFFWKKNKRYENLVLQLLLALVKGTVYDNTYSTKLEKDVKDFIKKNK